LERAPERARGGGLGGAAARHSRRSSRATASDVHSHAALALWRAQGFGGGIAASTCRIGLALATAMQCARAVGRLQAPVPLSPEMASGCSEAPRLLREAALQRSFGAMPKLCVWPSVRFILCVCVSIILEIFGRFLEIE